MVDNSSHVIQGGQVHNARALQKGHASCAWRRDTRWCRYSRHSGRWRGQCNPCRQLRPTQLLSGGRARLPRRQHGGDNTISGFDRHLDGSLTPLAGSPFTAGGRGPVPGWLPRVRSRSAATAASCSRWMRAATRCRFSGSSLTASLQLVPDGVVSSDGPTPVSIAVHNDLVYVANAGAVGPNYTGFTLNFFGQLQPLANSTVSLPNGSQPADVLFNGRVPAWSVPTRAGHTTGDRQLHRRPERAADRRSRIHLCPLRGSDHSAASSGRPIPSSCSSPTPTTWGPVPEQCLPSTLRTTGH